MSGYRLKIMVSSTVYGSESDLDQIGGILKGYGYDVVMSKNGTVYVPIGVSNQEACLRAVEECDLFLGIIFPRYGSGITHKEISHAIALDKPRWFIAHQYVPFARDLLKQYMFRGTRKNRKFKFKKTAVMDNVDVIHLYNEAIQNHLDSDKRRSHWAHPFFKTVETHEFIRTQFSDKDRRIQELKKLKQNE